MKHYDIIIVGAGASGVFLSYELDVYKRQREAFPITGGFV